MTKHPDAPSRHDKAITRIALVIKDSPDTSGGVQLRRFLWSLYNMHHFLSLWDFASRIDPDLAEPVAEIMRAALAGDLIEDDVKKGLLIAGEFSRWDETHPGPEAAILLEGARRNLASALLRTPPCSEHTEIQKLLKRLEAVMDSPAAR